MKQDEWAERLRHHLEDYREEPKRDLWEGIEGALDKTSHRQARVVAIRHWMAAAVIAGLVIVGTYLLWQQPIEENNHPSELVATSSQPEQTKQDTYNTLPKSEPVVPTTKEQPQPMEEKAEPVQESPSATPTNQTPTDQTPTNQNPTEIQTPVQHHPHYELPQPIESETKPYKRHHLTMGLYASATASGYNSRNGVLMSQSMLSNYAMTRGEVAFLAGYEERQSHDQPISFGLTFSYPLTKKLSVSSGIVYTKLNSDFTTIMQDNQIIRHQTLHYVGVPLNIQVALWQWNNLNVYLAAGGQIDWNIKAKANTDGVDQEMKKDRMQWSVGSSFGIQYNVMPQLGIYAEPGFRHYFDNGSNVSNFFKDKPTDFNLQLGLRYNFYTHRREIMKP